MIYIDKDISHNNFKELINNCFLDSYSSSINYSISRVKFSRTYNDKDCTNLQCEKASRSFKDLLEIVNTYYKVSEKELFNYIYSSDVIQDNIYIAWSYCNDINQIVFYGLSESSYKPSYSDRYKYVTNLREYYEATDSYIEINGYKDKYSYDYLDSLKEINNELQTTKG